MSDELMKVEPSKKVPVAFGEKGLQIATLDDAWRLSMFIAKSGLAPKGLKTPEAILVAIQFGAEVGLSAMASVQNIAPINGLPSIWGDAALALVRSSGLLEDYSERYEGTPYDDDFKCVVYSKRKGVSEPMETEFSVADAKQANLWGKDSPWRTFPKRMLKWRARGFNLRDNFGDVLKGLRITQEVMDDEPINITPVQQAVSKTREKATKLKEKLQDKANGKEQEKRENEAPTSAENFTDFLELNDIDVDKAMVYMEHFGLIKDNCVDPEAYADIFDNISRFKQTIAEFNQ